jgi:hypothetical protein
VRAAFLTVTATAGTAGLRTQVCGLISIVPVDSLRPDAGNDCLKLFECRRSANWFIALCVLQMLCWRNNNDPVPHRQIKHVFQYLNVKVPRRCAELVTRQPHIDIARSDLDYLDQTPGRPIAPDPVRDVRLLDYRFQSLMLHGLFVTVA